MYDNKGKWEVEKKRTSLSEGTNSLASECKYLCTNGYCVIMLDMLLFVWSETSTVQKSMEINRVREKEQTAGEE